MRDEATNRDGHEGSNWNEPVMGADYARPPRWKTTLAALGAVGGAIALFAAIVLRGVPGIAIGAALAAGLILPAGWWFRHQHREHLAATDPDAPAAVLDRRWRFIAPISLILLTIGAVLAIALPSPGNSPEVTDQETTTDRTPPKPSKKSATRSATPRPTTTITSTTTTPSSSESSEAETPTSSSNGPTTSAPRPTSEPGTEPTQPSPPTQPTPPAQPDPPTQPEPPAPPVVPPAPPAQPIQPPAAQ